MAPNCTAVIKLASSISTHTELFLYGCADLICKMEVTLVLSFFLTREMEIWVSGNLVGRRGMTGLGLVVQFEVPQEGNPFCFAFIYSTLLPHFSF